MKMRGAFLTITPGVLISATLGFASLEILVPVGAMLPSENTTGVPLSRKLSLPSPHASKTIGTEGGPFSARAIDPDDKGN